MHLILLFRFFQAGIEIAKLFLNEGETVGQSKTFEIPSLKWNLFFFFLGKLSYIFYLYSSCHLEHCKWLAYLSQFIWILALFRDTLQTYIFPCWKPQQQGWFIHYFIFRPKFWTCMLSLNWQSTMSPLHIGFVLSGREGVGKKQGGTHVYSPYLPIA